METDLFCVFVLSSMICVFVGKNDESDHTCVVILLFLWYFNEFVPLISVV
jgi:hypothetical protein